MAQGPARARHAAMLALILALFRAVCSSPLCYGPSLVPLSDDHGIDLMVLDKGTHKTLTIQVKSAIAGPNRATVQFDIRSATHSDAAGRYLLAVLFDPARASIATSWLIPMARVAEVSVAQADKYARSPCTAASSHPQDVCVAQTVTLRM